MGKIGSPLNKNSVDKCYTDSMPRLLIVVDEIAELTGKSGIKTTEGKKEDALKDEILSNIQSITQLGRSAGHSYDTLHPTKRCDCNIRTYTE